MAARSARSRAASAASATSRAAITALASASPASSVRRRSTSPVRSWALIATIWGFAIPAETRRRSRSSRTAETSAVRRRSALLRMKRSRSGLRSARRYSWIRSSSYFSGSTTQAMRSTRGSSSSTRVRCAVRCESMSGRSRIATWRSCGSACPTTWRTPSHSKSGVSSPMSCSDAQPTGSSVVGRTARTALTVRPASALRTLDFPTPVPPASART